MHNSKVEELLNRVARENLTTIDLSMMCLTSLPESLSNLTNLKGLYLSGNQLSSLPESLGNLTNLRWLNLENNQLIISLPESLGNLTNLRWLHLSGNQLEYLPKSLGNLTNLHGLYLSGNQLIFLPESLGNLTNLTKLHLDKNRLTSLPESCGNLTNLTELRLQENLLEYLPESLANLPKLSYLDFGNQQRLYNQAKVPSSPPKSMGTQYPNSTSFFWQSMSARGGGGGMIQNYATADPPEVVARFYEERLGPAQSSNSVAFIWHSSIDGEDGGFQGGQHLEVWAVEGAYSFRDISSQPPLDTKTVIHMSYLLVPRQP
jgi:hypothetical protein